jgi:hypothetical protein
MNANPVNRVFRLVLGLTYVLLGVFIYIKKVIPEPWDLLLSLAFILYGSWRIYRATAHTRSDSQ